MLNIPRVSSLTSELVLTQVLECQDHKFYLGGSRRMAERDPKVIKINALGTDYDFYITYTKEVYEFLTGIGFRVSASSYKYLDDNAELVMYYSNGPFENIQVVLRKDAEVYHRMFENISPEFYRDNIWKSGPNHLTQHQIRETINTLLKTGAK